MTLQRNTDAQQLPMPYYENSFYYAQRLALLKGFIWLDSGMNRDYGGRYDILTALPHTLFKEHADNRHTQNDVTTDMDVSEWMSAQLSSITSHDQSLPFSGGVLGFVTYESRHRHFGILPRNSTHLLSQLGLYLWALIQDHATQECWLYFSPQCSPILQQQVQDQLAQTIDHSDNFYCAPFTSTTPKQNYLQKAQKILAYIQAGDAYQVNLTQQFTAEFKGSSLAAYAALRAASPSPYGAYIATDTGAILSLSPEQFISIKSGNAITHPIKGTAPRNLDPTIDILQANNLLNSEKNRAENLMIVDLLRNDFSQNCQPFSVKTPELFHLKSFANVHHLISKVEGELKSGITAWNFFKTCFPGGSITGAPKKRAMEIISELEDHARTIYCGSIGYWNANGDMDTNIAIRTLEVRDGKIYIWGGGGVVADSDPEEEYAESLQKIQLLQTTLVSQSKK